MNDDPNSVADALDAWSDPDNVFEDTDDDRQILATAAVLLRQHADTTDRLAAALDRAERSDAKVRELVESEVATEARLAALTDAANEAQQFLWLAFQDDYRMSKCEPRENSIGCKYDIDVLRRLRALGLPDPREVVEIGNEHLWEVVYGEPLATAVQPPDPKETTNG
jgi:hypothetical protein